MTLSESDPDRKRLAAVKLATAGFRVFRIWPDAKTPAVDNWPAAATANPERIDALWRDWPECNVGVATGRGLLVLDIDDKTDSKGRPRNGSANLNLLTTLWGDLPSTLTVETPSGGRHYYLRFDPAMPLPTTVDLMGFSGIDARGDGGYVVGPGSIVDGREYRIIEGEKS